MADTKISALGSAGALAGTEPLPIVQGGVTVKTTVQDVADLAATPNLQQVTDEGNSTSNIIRSTDGVANKTDIGNGYIEISTGGGGAVTIDASLATAPYTAQLPDKAGPTETFAMISDIPSGAGDMLLASAQTNTGLKTFLNASFGLRNIANTFTSFFSNAATAARTWTLQNRDGILADDTDLALKLNLTGGSLSGALNEAQGANIASATTTDIGAATGNSNKMK